MAGVVLALMAAGGGPALSGGQAPSPIRLDDAQSKIAVLPQAMALSDADSGLTPERVEGPAYAGRWQALDRESYTKGVQNQYFWYRFTVTNPQSRREWWLKVGEAVLDDVRLYEPQPGGGWQVSRLGVLSPGHNKAYPHWESVFPIQVEAGKSQRYYLRVSSTSGMVIRAYLYQTAGLAKEQLLGSLFFGAYVGVVLVMALYNLMLFFSLRDINYLLYVLVTLFSGFFFFLINGWFALLMMPGWDSTALNAMAMVCFFPGVIFHVLFARSFLELKRNAPGLNKLFWGLAGGYAVLFPVSFLLSVQARSQIMVLGFLLLLVLNVSAALWVWRRGYKLAGYYLLAQIFYVMGSASYTLMVYGLLPLNDFTANGGPLGAMVELFLFSLALGARYRMLRDEKETAQAKVLSGLRENRTLKIEIARRLEAEQNLLEAKERAEHATRMKDKFVALVAHDIRSPFGTMMTMAEMLASNPEKPLDEEQAELVGHIQARGRKLVMMTEQLLNLNRLQTGHIVPKWCWFAPSEVADEALLLKPLADAKGVVLQNRIPPELRLYGDPDLMGEVLQNLVSNAIKFCREGDQISLYAPGNGDDLAVADTGQGISADLLPHLFSQEEKTSTTGTAGETGTGLGLPLSQEIMAAHGGSIRVESAPGKGATFYLKLSPGPKAG